MHAVLAIDVASANDVGTVVAKSVSVNNPWQTTAPGKDVFKEFNFTVEHILKKANELLNN